MRTCTQRFKVSPIRKFLRSIGVTKGIMWLGISTDEAERMKTSDVKWLQNSFPLIDNNISREDCENYLKKLGLAAVKSACVFCPYRSDTGWAKIKENDKDWKFAVDYDERLRKMAPDDVEWFVYRKAVPLNEAPIPDYKTMRGLFDESDGFGNECEGHCGV
jgi:hypothetical protein